MLRVDTTFTGTFPGTPYYSSFYFLGSGSVEASAGVEATGAFWEDVEPYFVDNLSYEVSGVVPIIDPATGNTTSIENTVAVTGQGSSSLPGLPASSQALVRWRTGVFVNGREIRGRTNIPGIFENANADGSFSGSIAALINTAAATFLTNSEPAGGFGVYSRLNGQIAEVTSASVWNQFSVLRSRRD